MNCIIVGCGNVGFETIKLLSVNSENSIYVINRSMPDYLDSLIRLTSNARISYHRADISEYSSVYSELLSIASECSEGIDAFVITAGVRAFESFLDDECSFRSKLLINYIGNIMPIICSLQIAGLLKSNARIVVVSSTSGHFARPGLHAYTPAKWALEGFCSGFRNSIDQSIDVICPRTIKNKYSKTFKTDSGVLPISVASVIVRLLNKPVNQTHFIPGRYRYFDTIERHFPEAFNLAFGLRPYFIRKHLYRRFSWDTVLILGSDTPFGLRIKEQILHYSKRVYTTLSEATEGVDVFINCIPTSSLDNYNDSVLNACNSAVDNIILGFTNSFSYLFNKKKPKCVVNVFPPLSVLDSSECIGLSAAISGLFGLTRAIRRKMGNEMQISEVIFSRKQDDFAKVLVALRDGSDHIEL